MIRGRGLPLLVISAALAACGSAPESMGFGQLMNRPAERALVGGIRNYDNGVYPAAEASLKRALGAGLASRRDQATAHKLLAFIQCTSNRVAACEASFRAARAADPAFALTPAEAGHPAWAPVYERSRKARSASK